MTILQPHRPHVGGLPFYRPLKLVVAPVPEPETSLVARSYTAGLTVIRFHPDQDADLVVPDTLAAITRAEATQWLYYWHIWVPIDLVYADPWKYLGHLRHIRTVPENIPDPLRV